VPARFEKSYIQFTLWGSSACNGVSFFPEIVEYCFGTTTRVTQNARLKLIPSLKGTGNRTEIGEGEGWPMKIAIYAFDICPVFREGRHAGSEYPEIEVSERLWREYVGTLDRFQELLGEIEQLVYAQAASRGTIERAHNGA
jgi:hypothetical protein